MPVVLRFDTFSLDFTYSFRNFVINDRYTPVTTKITELYLPARRYAEAFRAGDVQVMLSDGDWSYNAEVSSSATICLCNS